MFICLNDCSVSQVFGGGSSYLWEKKKRKKERKKSIFVSQTIKSLLALGRSFYLQGIKQICPDP